MDAAKNVSELFDLTGKTALITGSSKGIGRAIAERMAELGASVVVSSRKLDVCETVVEGIRGKGGTATAIACNINDKAQLQRLVDQSRDAFGKIDILVANAAVNPYFGPIQEIPDSAFDKILGANIRSNHWLSQMVIPEMAERKDGVVIIISSIGGLFGSKELGAYAISKAADMQMARNLAVEWGPKNVRVNCIAPGLIRTDFAKALWDDPEIYGRTVKRAPLHRIGEPDEIAGMAVYLSSRAGSFTTGQTLCVDGGVTIGEG
ncbi:MAG: glucose 1-dehydrogenase [Gammaproteobacteria bacterium]|nr:glucose 1-dehydrogenase [Gammaproteobacteria bacterium]